MTKYTTKAYGTMRFQIEKGEYTLEELEKLLTDCRETKYRLDDHLRKSITPTETKFRDRIGAMPMEDAIRIFGSKS